MGDWFCHSCGSAWTSDKRVPGPKETCACGAYLHCCLNCRFYRPGAHNQCAIPNTEWVADRRKGNFCDQFEFRVQRSVPQAEEQTRARATLEALFGVESPLKTRDAGDIFGPKQENPAPHQGFEQLFGESGTSE